MNPAGIVIAIAGIWVVSQVFAGNALERLNILKPSGSSGGGGVPGLPTVPGVAPNLPGGRNNPTAPNWGDLLPGGFGQGAWL